jgi:hypothetical protein
MDVVFLEVRVLDQPNPGTEPPVPTTGDPDLPCASPMPSIVHAKGPGTDESDVKDSGARQELAGLGVFFHTRTDGNAIPL